MRLQGNRYILGFALLGLALWGLTSSYAYHWLGPSRSDLSVGGGDGTDDEANVRTNGDQPGAPVPGENSPLIGAARSLKVAPSHARLEFQHIAGKSPGTGTDFQFLPGKGDMLMTLREGQLAYLHIENRKTHVIKVWDFSEEMIIGDACGPSNLSLDPHFLENRYIYVTYCPSPTKDRLVRYELDYDRGPVNPSTVLELDAQGNELWRRFGSIGWEDERTLWMLVGDHAKPADAQDLGRLQGKLIRIRPRRGPGEQGFELPSPVDFGQGTKQHGAVYAYGFRAPWRGTRDSSGRFWIGDVGDEDFEEVNLVLGPGQNFGWDLYSGPCKKGCQASLGPIVHYDRSDHHRYLTEEPRARSNASRTVWVGQIYEAPATDRYLGLMNGVVAFGDMFTGIVRGLRADALGQLVEDEPLGVLPYVTQWRVGPDGFIYALDLGGNMHVALLAEH